MAASSFEAHVLHTGAGPIPSTLYIAATAANTLWGQLPAHDDEAVLTIDPGSNVTIDTLSHEGLLADQGGNPIEFFARHGVAAADVLDDAIELAATGSPGLEHGPHVVTGPIRVRGARPGDLLSMRVDRLVPRVPYGVISNRHGRGALPGEYPRGSEPVSVFARIEDGEGVIARSAASQHEARFPLGPFLGIMGVAQADGGRPHSVPPLHVGGNLDINLLTEGAILHLPVEVDGALAFVGDPHFAQGDGEVALTAFEASLRATVTFDLTPATDPLARFVQSHGPLVETPEFLCPTGLDPDLRKAVKKGVRASIALLTDLFGFDDEHAYAYLSAATDLRISQVVDGTTGVHATIRKADIR